MRVIEWLTQVGAFYSLTSLGPSLQVLPFCPHLTPASQCSLPDHGPAHWGGLELPDRCGPPFWPFQVSPTRGHVRDLYSHRASWCQTCPEISLSQAMTHLCTVTAASRPPPGSPALCPSSCFPTRQSRPAALALLEAWTPSLIAWPASLPVPVGPSSSPSRIPRHCLPLPSVGRGSRLQLSASISQGCVLPLSLTVLPKDWSVHFFSWNSPPDASPQDLCPVHAALVGATVLATCWWQVC